MWVLHANSAHGSKSDTKRKAQETWETKNYHWDIEYEENMFLFLWQEKFQCDLTSSYEQSHDIE